MHLGRALEHWAQSRWPGKITVASMFCRDRRCQSQFHKQMSTGAGCRRQAIDFASPKPIRAGPYSNASPRISASSPWPTNCPAWTNKAEMRKMIGIRFCPVSAARARGIVAGRAKALFFGLFGRLSVPRTWTRISHRSDASRGVEPRLQSRRESCLLPSPATENGCAAP